MNNQEIITVWKIQSGHVESTESEFMGSLKIKIERGHIIQVLEHLGHCNNIIKDTDTRLEWYKFNNWSSLVALMDSALGLNTDSYLNTIS